MPRLPIEGLPERRPHRRLKLIAAALTVGTAAFGVFICTRPQVQRTDATEPLPWPAKVPAGRAPARRAAARRPQRKERAEAPLSASGPIRPSPYSAGIWKKVQKLDPELRRIRRYLHAHPEPSGHEVATARFVAEQLARSGVKVQTGVAKTGVVGVLEGKGPGPAIALVAGMDGVPIRERTRAPYASRQFVVEGGRKIWYSHAGGRDVEMAILLGVARVLGEMRSVTGGAVKFLFQPASERRGPRNGAHAFIQAGVLGSPPVSALVWLVVAPGLRIGKVGLPTARFWRGASRFRLVFRSMSTQGCVRPGGGACVDPVLAAAQALVAIQSQVGRTLGGSVARVTVHRLEADSEPGTVPGRVSVEGTLRYRSVAAYRKAVDVLTKAARGAAMAAGARVSVSFGAYESFAASDPALVRWILPTARRVLGLHGLSLGASARQTPGFAVYAHQVSSALVLLGTHSNRLGTRRRLYTSTFDVDEECLSVGVHFLANVALDWLLEHAGKSGKKGRR